MPIWEQNYKINPINHNLLCKTYNSVASMYGAQNEAYMSRSAEKLVRGLCFNELGVCG